MGIHKIYQKLVVRSGTPVQKFVVYAPTLTPTTVAANSASAQTHTVTGLATTDRIIGINQPQATVTPLGIVGMRVSATNTLEVTWLNPYLTAETPTVGEYKVISVRV